MLGFSREENRMKRTSRSLALTAVSLFLGVVAIDCSRGSSARPLEVTYYYLPG
jgi:hypothetical protein